MLVQLKACYATYEMSEAEGISTLPETLCAKTPQPLHSDIMEIFRPPRIFASCTQDVLVVRELISPARYSDYQPRIWV